MRGWRWLAAIAAVAGTTFAGCGGGTASKTQTSTATPVVASSAAASTTTTTLQAHTAATSVARPRRRRRTRPRAHVSAVPSPPIVADPIPFGPGRLAEMRAYAERHYGLDSYRLVDPHVIVIHFTDTTDFRSTYNTFAPDVPDVELHELPGVCSHFVIDRDGTIYQLVPLDIMCRHTVGLNWTAIGIEHVGFSDAEVMNNPREFDASLALVHWLRCRFHISVDNVIGHNESLSSPYHHENVAALRTQTHDDFRRADMDAYRARLRGLGGCPS